MWVPNSFLKQNHIDINLGGFIRRNLHGDAASFELDVCNVLWSPEDIDRAEGEKCEGDRA